MPTNTSTHHLYYALPLPFFLYLLPHCHRYTITTPQQSHNHALIFPFVLQAESRGPHAHHVALAQAKASKVDLREDIVRRVMRFATLSSKPASDASDQVKATGEGGDKRRESQAQREA